MKRYFRTLILSKTPLTFVYRYKDRFQIYPIENDAIESCYAKHFPLYLEFVLDVSAGLSKEELEKVVASEEKEIVRLLSMLTSFHFFFYTGDCDRWGIQTSPAPFGQLSKEEKSKYKNQISNWTASVVYTKYHKCVMLEIDHLYDTTFPPMVFAKDIDNYFRYHIDDPTIKNIAFENGYEYKLIFPQTISSCLDNYYTLNQKHKQIIRSSIYLAYDGEEALGFIGIISAIEGLTKLFQDSLPKINSKGKNIYPSKEVLFINLLSNLFSSDDYDLQYYKYLYEIRCDITHDNKLFSLDYGLTPENTETRPIDDWRNITNALVVFRTILSKILLYPTNQDWIE